MATSVWRALGALVATAAACGLTACNCRTCCGPAAPATAPTPASAPAVAAQQPAPAAQATVWRHRQGPHGGGYRPSPVRYNAAARGGEEHYGYLSEEEARTYVSPYAARRTERSERYESRTYEETREHVSRSERDCERLASDGRRLDGCPPLRRVADRDVRLPGSFFYDDGGVGPSLTPVYGGGGGGGVAVAGGSASASASASVRVGVRVSFHGGGHGGGHGGHGCGCGGRH